MKRINITLYDDMFNKIQDRIKNTGGKSIAHEIRELLDLALRIEEAAKNNDEIEQQNDNEQILGMLKNSLVWSLETRLLTRHLVEKLASASGVNQSDILIKSKDKAIAYVDGLLKSGI